ncbi:uncharacterized protein LOC130047783 isoform X1 [Ostrea edulis]|uniref:uncharacterized protein LOC130047782 isoform X1 n=2 Tax=Ostrea edulis TaxID=37623 RepID=UPI0024AF4E7F|nr:uncharacterized protein LOC130047782 isoform X1 [Ostrea edulis]XP_055999191.1 uncharacterized protein LOC130047783 isoform X1 [Ostrea edulis]
MICHHISTLNLSQTQSTKKMVLRFTVLLAFTVCNVVDGYTSDLKFDKYCDDFDTITIYSDDVYYVKWSGTPLSDTCSFRFSPFDSDYKVCVEATSFYISSCSTRLKYYGGLIASDLEDSYSCLDPTPDKFCGDTFDDVKIRLTTSSSSFLPGFFTLKVTAKNGNRVGIVAGSVVGSIVFAIIVVAVIVVICRRRRYYPPGVIVSPANQPQVVTSTSAYSGGVVNPNYSNAAGAGGVMNSYPPPYNATTNHPPPYTGSTTSYPNPGQKNAYPSGYPNQLPNNQI